MLHKILNLDGVQKLSKIHQKEIQGGNEVCYDGIYDNCDYLVYCPATNSCVCGNVC